jgi:sugar lactone lactonase YvrE
MNDVARVDASGHTCELPAGWLSVRPIRRRGSLYAKVEQKNVGHGAAIELSPERFGVASVKLRIPWFIPDGNLCASGVGIGMTPPGSSKSFPSMIYSQCGVGLIGVLQATVSPFHAISSGVPHATGVSVARLQPGPMALGPNGILYFSEPALNQVVARLADGSFKLIAGTGKRGDSGDGGRAVRAMLADPQGIALAANGTLYIADFGNNRVRAVLPDGTIETVAGDGGKTPVNFPPNGPPSGRPALQVNVVSPSAVAIGPDGSLYVAATNDNAIVEVRNGVLTNVVTGRDLGALQRKENTRICGPAGLVFDTLGDLYFDCADASSLLMRTPAGQVIYRGSMQGPGFSGLSGAGGDQVGLTLGKIVFLKPAGGEAETLPTVVAGIGAFSPQGIAIAANGTIYLDQGYDPYDAPSGNDPPAIVAVQSGKISTLWAADT